MKWTRVLKVVKRSKTVPMTWTESRTLWKIPRRKAQRLTIKRMVRMKRMTRQMSRLMKRASRNWTRRKEKRILMRTMRQSRMKIWKELRRAQRSRA